MHAEVGMKLNMAKCHIIQDSVVYLGHRVSAEGVQMLDEYVKKITEWKKPETGKQMRTWLGFIGYYRSFFPSFARLTAKMNEERNKNTVQWNEQMEKDFEEIKVQFQKRPIRAYPDYYN